MKALITGASGAVGSALRSHLADSGIVAVGWDRAAAPPDRPDLFAAYVDSHAPSHLFHLAVASESTGRENEGWLVNVEWSRQLAELCRDRGIAFLYTSSVMVYTDDAVGPFTPETIPDAADGYGYEKLQAEAAVRAANPDAVIVRIGWQIDFQPGSNNMVDFLQRQMEEQGGIRASRRWYPACSFLPDTAAALWRLAQTGRGELFLVDSNRGWTFYEIVQALNTTRGIPWRIDADDAFVYDQRLIDPRPAMPSLAARLPALAVTLGE